MLSSFVMSLIIRLTNNQILHITNFMTLIDFLFNFHPQKVLCIKFTELKKKIFTQDVIIMTIPRQMGMRKT